MHIVISAAAAAAASPDCAETDTAPDLVVLLLGPAVIAAVVAGAVSLAQIWTAGRRENKRMLQEFRLRQLNDLFGPLQFSLAQVKTIGKTLRETAESQLEESKRSSRENPWHILDNIPEICANEQLKGMADDIAAINSSIITLMEKNSGLALEDAIPESYELFVRHTTLLRRGLNDNKSPAQLDAKYFPKEFEIYVNKKHAETVAALRKSLGSSRRKTW